MTTDTDDVDHIVAEALARAQNLNPMINDNLLETALNVASVLDFLSCADVENLGESAHDGLSLVLSTASKALSVSVDLSNNPAESSI